jgi:alkylation response protein AidB-like acyl-CoA dehydrogenase
MRLDLEPELDSFRAKVRAFIAEHAPGRKPHTGTRAPADEQLPAIRAWTAALYQAGYLGIDWPAEFGGRPDAHPMEATIVAEEIARAGTWPPLSGGQLAAAALIHFGTKEQQAHYLPRISSGTDIWCQLFSEPGAGSDLAGLRARARREGDSFVLDGQKVWTTNARAADRGFLLARTDPQVPRHRGITAFALDMTSPGITIRPLREITGTADFNEVFFDGVVIPATDVIGQVNDGWSVAMGSLAHERSSIAAYSAALFPALTDLVRLATEPGPDGACAMDDPVVRHRVGRLAARILVNDYLNKMSQTAVTADPADAPARKVFFSELNLALAELGVALQGVDGILTEDDPAVRGGGWWQDALLYSRAFTISGGSNEIMRNVIAERGLGLPR